MQIEKNVILDDMRGIHNSILKSLRSPSTDGRCPTPVPAWIQGFIDANIVFIAEQALNKFHGDAIDEDQYGQFMNDFFYRFKQLDIRKATVHYMPDYSASCYDYLQSLMSSWDGLVANRPYARALSLIKKIDIDIDKRMLSACPEQFKNIDRSIKTEKFEPHEHSEIASLFQRLKNRYKTCLRALESELEDDPDQEGLPPPYHASEDGSRAALPPPYSADSNVLESKVPQPENVKAAVKEEPREPVLKLHVSKEAVCPHLQWVDESPANTAASSETADVQKDKEAVCPHLQWVDESPADAALSETANAKTKKRRYEVRGAPGGPGFFDESVPSGSNPKSPKVSGETNSSGKEVRACFLPTNS